MTITLTVKGADGVERKVRFERPRISIGSDPMSDVRVVDPGVDREQAVVLRRDDRIELFDIGEAGAVLVNGRPVSHATLQPGDEVWVGRTVLTVLEEARAGVSFTESRSTVREELPAVLDSERTEAILSPDAAPADQRIALLNEVRRLINSIGTDSDIFESILDTVFSSIPVRRGFIGLVDDEGGLEVKAHRSRELGAGGGEAIEVSRTLVGAVISKGRSVLTSDAEADAAFHAAQSIHRLRIRAAICVPLTVEDRVIGLLYGDNRERPGSLTREHLTVLRTLASVAAVAVEKFRLLSEYDAKVKLEQALAIAQTIQTNFLPASPPETEWLDLWGSSRSADETGGDYFDFLPHPDGALRVVVADVTGHGIGPALLMATVRAGLRALVSSERSPERLVSRLNNLICDDVRDGRFITLFLGLFDPGEQVFCGVGAGHTPPILFRASDRTTHALYSKGPPLGILRDRPFHGGESVALEAGDVMLFITDGILEASNAAGEQFGLARLRAVLAENAERSAREIVEAVAQATDRFVDHEPLHDDATLVAVKIRPR